MPIDQLSGSQDRAEVGQAVSATEPDWTREHKGWFEWAPSRSLLASIRCYQRWQGKGLGGLLMRKWAIARHRGAVAVGIPALLAKRRGVGRPESPQ
jgi:serine O-acetyltransferase